jgi:endonuclease/exonuclease/phosphatase (EEP) superfamily protein YafD
MTLQDHTDARKSPRSKLTQTARIAASLLLFTAFALSIASLPARTWWIADVLANLRVQACLATATLLAALLLLKLKYHSLLATLLLSWHASFLQTAFVPTTTVHNTTPAPLSPPATLSPHISICLANVHFNNSQHRTIIDALRHSDADLLVVVELNQALRNSLTRQLTPNYPHTVWADREPGAFGIGVLSRLPLHNARIRHFGVPANNNQHSRIPAITADVQTPEGPLHLIAVHCMPPIGQASFQLRSRQLVDAATAAQARQSTTPVILVGDLNLTPWAPAFHDLLDQSALINSASGHGIEPTWNAGPRYPCGLLIDHILHSRHLTCLSRQILPPVNSDHQPVLAHFRISDPVPQRGSAMPSASHPYSPDPPPDTTP